MAGGASFHEGRSVRQGRLLVDVPAGFSDVILPRGSEGVVVETYERPREGYAVDVRIADDRLAGGARWENVMLTPDQFEVVAPGQA